MKKQLTLTILARKDRPQIERVEWDVVVIAESVRQDLKSLIRLLGDPARTRALGIDIPTGLLLIGLPRTGKTMVATLIASQTKRSFYSLTAASVLGGGRYGNAIRCRERLGGLLKYYSRAA